MTEAKTPWVSEPNKLQFTFREFICQIVRHPEILHLCGYVAVPWNHPLYGINYSDPIPGYAGRATASSLLQVHDGITFSGTRNVEGLQALPWAFGFDCAHSGDLCPGISSPLPGAIYRDLEYVRAETIALAAQLDAYATWYRSIKPAAMLAACEGDV